MPQETKNLVEVFRTFFKALLEFKRAEDRAMVVAMAVAGPTPSYPGRDEQKLQDVILTFQQELIQALQKGLTLKQQQQIKSNLIELFNTVPPENLAEALENYLAQQCQSVLSDTSDLLLMTEFSEEERQQLASFSEQIDNAQSVVTAQVIRGTYTQILTQLVPIVTQEDLYLYFQNPVLQQDFFAYLAKQYPDKHFKTGQGWTRVEFGYLLQDYFGPYLLAARSQPRPLSKDATVIQEIDNQIRQMDELFEQMIAAASEAEVNLEQIAQKFSLNPLIQGVYTEKELIEILKRVREISSMTKEGLAGDALKEWREIMMTRYLFSEVRPRLIDATILYVPQEDRYSYFQHPTIQKGFLAYLRMKYPEKRFKTEGWTQIEFSSVLQDDFKSYLDSIREKRAPSPLVGLLQTLEGVDDQMVFAAVEETDDRMKQVQQLLEQMMVVGPEANLEQKAQEFLSHPLMKGIYTQEEFIEILKRIREISSMTKEGLSGEALEKWRNSLLSRYLFLEVRPRLIEEGIVRASQEDLYLYLQNQTIQWGFLAYLRIVHPEEYSKTQEGTRLKFNAILQDRFRSYLNRIRTKQAMPPLLEVFQTLEGIDNRLILQAVQEIDEDVQRRVTLLSTNRGDIRDVRSVVSVMSQKMTALNEESRTGVQSPVQELTWSLQKSLDHVKQLPQEFQSAIYKYAQSIRELDEYAEQHLKSRENQSKYQAAKKLSEGLKHSLFEYCTACVQAVNQPQRSSQEKGPTSPDQAGSSQLQVTAPFDPKKKTKEALDKFITSSTACYQAAEPELSQHKLEPILKSIALGALGIMTAGIGLIVYCATLKFLKKPIAIFSSKTASQVLSAEAKTAGEAIEAIAKKQVAARPSVEV